jgi:hypothetical protein
MKVWMTFAGDLNWIWIEKNEMQIGEESIENLLINYVVGRYKINIKKMNLKHTFPCLFTWEWAKHNFSWNCPNVD